MQMTREDARGHFLEEPVGDGILEKELREFVQAEDLGSFDDKIKLLKLKQMFFWEGTGLSRGDQGRKRRIWKIFRTDVFSKF